MNRLAKNTTSPPARSRRYVRLGSLDGSLLKLLDGGKLPLTTALRLVDFSAENQKYLAAHHADELAGPKMARLTTAMTPEQMDAALQAEPQTVRVSVTVPAALEEDFRRMAEEWAARPPLSLYGPGMPARSFPCK